MAKSPAEESAIASRERHKELVKRIKAVLPPTIAINGAGLLWYKTPAIDKLLGQDTGTHYMQGRMAELASMLRSTSLADILEVEFVDEDNQNQDKQRGLTEAPSGDKTGKAP